MTNSFESLKGQETLPQVFRDFIENHSYPSTGNERFGKWSIADSDLLLPVDTVTFSREVETGDEPDQTDAIAFCAGEEALYRVWVHESGTFIVAFGDYMNDEVDKADAANRVMSYINSCEANGK